MIWTLGAWVDLLLSIIYMLSVILHRLLSGVKKFTTFVDKFAVQSEFARLLVTMLTAGLNLSIISLIWIHLWRVSTNHLLGVAHWNLLARINRMLAHRYLRWVLIHLPLTSLVVAIMALIAVFASAWFG